MSLWWSQYAEVGSDKLTNLRHICILQNFDMARHVPGFYGDDGDDGDGT